MKIRFLVLFYLLSIISANLLIQQFGAYALWISSFILIPFDFVARCILHEKWKGFQLVLRFFILTFFACLATYAINNKAEDIAIASVLGFTSAQVAAGVFYQLNKKRGFFFKVNMSDLIAISFDSVIFQFYAFDSFNPYVTTGQVLIKFIGGLLWFWLLFSRLKIHEKI